MTNIKQKEFGTFVLAKKRGVLYFSSKKKGNHLSFVKGSLG